MIESERSRAASVQELKVKIEHNRRQVTNILRNRNWNPRETGDSRGRPQNVHAQTFAVDSGRLFAWCRESRQTSASRVLSV